MTRHLLSACFFLLCGGCTTYQTAQNVKLISFDDDVSSGKSLGPVEGEDCIWSILGYRLGGNPTLDRAFASARAQSKSQITDVVSSSSKVGDAAVRYMNNVSTSYDGFNAVVVGKQCLIVKGTGFK